MEGRWIFFRPFRWINHPFKCLRVLSEGLLAEVAAASEAEVGFVPRGATLGVEVSSGRVRCYCCIGLIWRLGGDAVI